MLRNFISLTVLFVLSLMFGLHSSSRADGIAGLTNDGTKSNSTALYIENNATVVKNVIDSASWFYVTDGNWDFEGSYDSLVITKSADGKTLTATATLEGYLYGFFDATCSYVWTKTGTSTSLKIIVTSGGVNYVNTYAAPYTVQSGNFAIVKN